MKILIINQTFSKETAGGADVIALKTYQLLKEAGHNVFCFAANKQPYLENQPWIKYFPHYTKTYKPWYCWNFEAQYKLAKMLDDVKPDIVHIHSFQILSYSILAPIFKRKIPVVMTAHETYLKCPVMFGWDLNQNKPCKKCTGFNNLPCIVHNCSINKKFISNCFWAFNNFLQKLSGYNKKIDKFITPSQALADYISSGDIDKNKVTVVPNFIDDEFMQDENKTNKKDYFLFVGYLSRQKGVDILLKAIKDLPRDIPFKIIGSGDAEQQYKQYVQENRLTNVKFLGNLDRKDIIKYYQDCISIIVPSNYFENFPTVILESFACSKPAIGSMVGGISEQIEDNQTGLLFEACNVEQLKDCILKYWNNKRLAIEHGKNAMSKVAEKYNKVNYYDNLMKVYNNIFDFR